MKHPVKKWSVSICQWRSLEARINIQWIQDSETQCDRKNIRGSISYTDWWSNVLMIAEKIQNCSTSCLFLCFLKHGFESYKKIVRGKTQNCLSSPNPCRLFLELSSELLRVAAFNSFRVFLSSKIMQRTWIKR